MPFAMLYRLCGARALDLWQDTKGGIAMVFSLAFIPLVIAIGVAVDAGRGYVVETRLTSAIDAAGLAAASAELTTKEELAELTWEYFRRNYGLDENYSFDHVTATYYQAGPDDLDDIRMVSADGLIELEILQQQGENIPDIVVTASSNMPTTFMRVAGINEIEIAVNTEVMASQQGLELVLVMDNTGSMRGDGSMDRMKEAARGLINALYTDDFDTVSRHDATLRADGEDAVDTLWVGLVPYSSVVNIGRGALDQAWDETNGWRSRTFVADPDTNTYEYQYSAADTGHSSWLNTVPILQLPASEAYDEVFDHSGPERPGLSLDTYYQGSVRNEHGEYYRPRCFRDTEDVDEDGDEDEYLFEVTDALDRDDDDDVDEYLYRTENAADDGLTEESVCDWVDGDPRGWLGCVMARPHPMDVSDDPPTLGSSYRFTPYRWVSDSGINDQDATNTALGNLNGCENTTRYRDERNDDDDGGTCYNSWPSAGTNDNGDPIYWAQNARQNAGLGPNLGCPPAITPMSDNYTVIMDAIDEMEPWHRGGTWSPTGMAWGWRMISPRWRSLWNLPYTYDAVQLPLEYGHSNMQKVVVVLTDGTNQWYQDDFTAYGFLEEGRAPADGGFGTTNESNATNEANSRMVEICENMRGETTNDGDPTNDNIVIYAIVLADSGQASTFQSCASSTSHYFFAADNSELAGIFRQISDDLTSLRITR